VRVRERSVSRAGFALLTLVWLGSAAADPHAEAERIYRAGVLPSGKPLLGTREGGALVTGEAAACVNCHRRSGLGLNEGVTPIPPISGKYLAQPAQRALPEAQRPSAGTSIVRRKAYDDRTLARAIRVGVDADGKPLSYLMPRFALDETDMGSLIAYLKSLSSQSVPGLAHDHLEFATIVTPDADPAERSSMIDVLQHFFASKNHFERGHDPQLVSSSRRIHYRVTFQWHLHVWELSGPPQTWETQLREHFKAEPVFAVISGVGGSDWGPVHRFCQQQHLPCLFPNVQLPVVAEGDFYPVYFSRGVLLEADLIRARWQAANALPRRVVQLFRPGDIGEAAAQALHGHRSNEAIEWVDRPMAADGSTAGIRAALAAVRAGDTLVLWLRAADLRELPAEAPPADIFVSGLMGGLEAAPLPPAWRASARLTYPVDLPPQRAMRLIQPLTWFRTRQIPVLAERVQVDTYIACQVLSEAVTHAFADLVPDYLIEQIENMISLKLLDGYYPRLGLAPGQRFASKGGYIVRLAPNPGGPLAVDGDWTVPQ
jgi:hypothetical protein